MIREALDVEQALKLYRVQVDARLDELVPPASAGEESLQCAMRHSLLAEGKRLRPTLTMLTAESLGADPALALDPACAVELAHTASLILDDLPCMDDATVRRGRPTCHRQFGEDVATLAAVALLNRAFGVLSASDLEPGLRVELCGLLSRMIGDDGVVIGQMQDLRQVVDDGADLQQLEQIARGKTSALFVTSAEAGAMVAGASAEIRGAMRAFAWNLGLGYQVLDDVLDHSGCGHNAGKDVGQDTSRPTFVSVLGAEGARRRVDHYLSAAVGALGPIGPRAAALERVTRHLFAPARAVAGGR